MPRKTAKPHSIPQPTIAVAAQPEPGSVLSREPVSTVELRLANLENLFDLMALRLAIAESTTQAALERVKLLQARETKDLIGL